MPVYNLDTSKLTSVTAQAEAICRAAKGLAITNRKVGIAYLKTDGTSVQEKVIELLRKSTDPVIQLLPITVDTTPDLMGKMLAEPMDTVLDETIAISYLVEADGTLLNWTGLDLSKKPACSADISPLSTAQACLGLLAEEFPGYTIICESTVAPTSSAQAGHFAAAGTEATPSNTAAAGATPSRTPLTTTTTTAGATPSRASSAPMR